MKPTSDAEAPEAKLLGGLRTKALVAAAGVLILVLGVLTRPHAVTPVPLPQPSQEKPAPLIEAELANRRALSGFEASQEIGGRAAAFSVTIAPSKESPRHTRSDVPERERLTPLNTGVLVSDASLVLTHATAMDRRIRVPILAPAAPASSGAGLTPEAVDATAVAFEPQSGMVLLRLDRPLQRPAAPMAATRPAAGDLLTAAALFGERPYVSAVTVISVDASRSIVRLGQSLPPGMPLYDMAGGLAAVASHDAMAVLANETLTRLTALAESGGGAIGSATGIVLQAIDPSLTPWFGADGVIVADVITGSPADAAGLVPGDVIAGIAESPVAAIDDALARLKAAPAHQPLALDVRRRSMPTPAPTAPAPTTALTVTPMSVLELYGAERGRPEDIGAGRAASIDAPAAREARGRPRVRDVIASTGQQVPGAGGDAVVLAVNRQPVTTLDAAARQVRRARGGALLYVDEDGERFFAATTEGTTP